MAITKQAVPCGFEIHWDTDGTLVGASVTYVATFTDSVTGTIGTKVKGPIAIDITKASIINSAANIYAALPASGL